MASRVFAKLNLKDQTEILVIDPPRSFEAELDHLEDVRVHRKLTPGMSVAFALVFVTTQAGIDAVARPLAKAAAGDAVIWFAYPKGTSKNYTSTIDRDHGWNALGDAGFETVRMIAIDEDWTAKRLRRAEYIKTMKRPAEWAMSRQGKEKASRPHGSVRSRS
ncbi:MAG TPA: hypothetical protein VFV95_15970 [Vicinamibacterales bacterium]|nr:hypothetical protein [Vicinamibacterales bacterium]